jgi:hypothetical protein
MTREQAIRQIVFLETTAKHYCGRGSQRRRDCLAEARKLRMKQNPPETRKIYQLQAAIRTGASHD